LAAGNAGSPDFIETLFWHEIRNRYRAIWRVYRPTVPAGNANPTDGHIFPTETVGQYILAALIALSGRQSGIAFQRQFDNFAGFG
jgi:hypothetical protein